MQMDVWGCRLLFFENKNPSDLQVCAVRGNIKTMFILIS